MTIYASLEIPYLGLSDIPLYDMLVLSNTTLES